MRFLLLFLLLTSPIAAFDRTPYDLFEGLTHVVQVPSPLIFVEASKVADEMRGVSHLSMTVRLEAEMESSHLAELLLRLHDGLLAVVNGRVQSGLYFDRFPVAAHQLEITLELERGVSGCTNGEIVSIEMGETIFEEPAAVSTLSPSNYRIYPVTVQSTLSRDPNVEIDCYMELLQLDLERLLTDEWEI